MDEGTAEAEDGIQVANAGLVLLAPFLPRLFSSLEIVENSTFKDLPAAGRGVHVLQWLVDEPAAAPEIELVLNKLLCGLEPDFQVTRSVDPDEAEVKAVEGLLTAAIEHWGSLGSTSIEGLQSAFLKRRGRLVRADDGWRLLVEGRAHDVLLDRIPWGFSVIALPWMEGIIRVDWR